MSTSLVLGVVATIVALAVFLFWSFHELKRVDEFAPPDDSGGSDEDAS